MSGKGLYRIILHWTAGTHRVSDHDRRAYHFIVAGDGAVHHGDLAPEENDDVSDGIYARHARRANTGAIGVAMAAMGGAVERPFDPGDWPMTEQQIESACRLVAQLCVDHRIPVRRDTVLSHAELYPTLAIPQAGKWDIAWLPGMERPGDPVHVGDTLRARIRDHTLGEVRPRPPERIEDVEDAQRFLVSEGYDPGPIDGEWGPLTRAATLAWLEDMTNMAPGEGAELFAAMSAVKDHAA